MIHETTCFAGNPNGAGFLCRVLKGGLNLKKTYLDYLQIYDFVDARGMLV
jgi:hypothetical protein